MVVEIAARFTIVASHLRVFERAWRPVQIVATVRRHASANVTIIVAAIRSVHHVHAVSLLDIKASLAWTAAALLSTLAVVLLARASARGAGRLQVHALIISVRRRRELHLLVFKLFLDELFGISELRQLNFLLLDNEGREAPFSALLVPLRLLLDLVHLLVGHKEACHLVQEVELLGLLSHCIQKLFITLRILLVDIFQFRLGRLEFLSQLLDDLTIVLDFLVERVVVLLFDEELSLCTLLLL